MATYNITVTGARKIEALRIERVKTNAERIRRGRPTFATNEEFVQHLIDEEVKQLKVRHADAITAALHPTEAAAVAAAQAALDAAAAGDA